MLMICWPLDACHYDGIEQVNFHIVFDQDARTKANALAKKIGLRTGMKVFYREPADAAAGGAIEIYDSGVSIDILSVPCDPVEGRPSPRFSEHGYFVTIGEKDRTGGQKGLKDLADLVKKETVSLGGRIASSAPSCG